MSDVDIINKLNKKLRSPLKERDKLTWFLKGYKLNSVGDVIQINLFKAHLNGEIPQELFELKHLEHLDIRENDIIEVPKELSQLHSLRFLDLRNNSIDDLPNELSELKELEKLYLANNQFKKVPQALAVFESLWLIDLMENQISEGCEILLEAPMLTNIYLKDNQIKQFPFNKVESFIDELILLNNPMEKPENLPMDYFNKLMI